MDHYMLASLAAVVIAGMGFSVPSLLAQLDVNSLAGAGIMGGLMLLLQGVQNRDLRLKLETKLGLKVETLEKASEKHDEKLENHEGRIIVLEQRLPARGHGHD